MAGAAGSTGIFRVTVRGRFHDLTDDASRRLAAARADHDIFLSAYTAEGTLTYDERVDFFNFRYEVRDVADAEEAAEHALAEAGMFLEIMGYGHGELRANAVDMLAMMRDT